MIVEYHRIQIDSQMCNLSNDIIDKYYFQEVWVYYLRVSAM